MPLPPPAPPVLSSPAAPAPAPPLLPVRFRIDLLRLPGADACKGGNTEEIVVCARRESDSPRLPALRDPVPRARKAEIGIIGNLRGAATVQQTQVAANTPGSSVMVTLKLPF